MENASLPWPLGLAWGRDCAPEDDEWETMVMMGPGYQPRSNARRSDELRADKPPRVGQTVALQLKMHAPDGERDAHVDPCELDVNEPWESDCVVRGTVERVFAAPRIAAVAVARVSVSANASRDLRQAFDDGSEDGEENDGSEGSDGGAGNAGPAEEWIAVLRHERTKRMHRLVALAPAFDPAAAPLLDPCSDLHLRLDRLAKDLAREAKSMILRLRIRLLGIDPPIHRTVEIRGDSPLLVAHSVLNEAMGWNDSHMHQFHVKGLHAVDELPFDEGQVEENKLKLCDLGLVKGDRFWYHYDSGDNWYHEVEVEAVFPPQRGISYPRCTDGARACPPEDSGGAGGYEEFLAAATDRSSPRYEAWRVEWAADQAARTRTNRGAVAGGVWRPEHFDVAAVNAVLPQAVRRGKQRQTGAFCEPEGMYMGL
eukprot:tig00020553_g10577.t1